MAAEDPPPTLPLELRNRLAALILGAFGDADAHRELAGLAAGCRPAPPAEWVGSLEVPLVELFCARVERAAAALARWPLKAIDDRRAALAAAALLFDAGLYFEVHEALEPHWIRARGGERVTLQGLIQIAVAYQHLANGNRKGALALLADGAARLVRRRLDGLDLRPFEAGVVATLANLRGHGSFTWAQVPPFPREG